MSSEPLNLLRFSRAIHRRYVVINILEKIGMALLIGCGGAALLMPIVWWQGRSPIPAMALSLVTSVLVGLLAGLLRRPTQLNAVGRADQQLNLQDLLSTAVVLYASKSTQTDPWNTSLLALADARCKTISPGDILLRRWTQQRWGGVGLLTSLVLSLALLAPTAENSWGDIGKNSGLGQPELLTVVRQIPGTAKDASSFHLQSSQSRDPSAESQPEQTTVATIAAKSDPLDPSKSERPSSASGNSEGSGASHTLVSNQKTTLLSNSPADRSAPRERTGPTAADGQAATPSDTADRSPSSANGTSAENRPVLTAPPWQTSTWTSDQKNAQDQILSGTTYDPYRDLIRGYFEHH